MLRELGGVPSYRWQPLGTSPAGWGPWGGCSTVDAGDTWRMQSGEQARQRRSRREAEGMITML